MDKSLTTVLVTSSTTVREVLDSFKATTDDLLLLDQNSVIAKPHLELLTDYPRSASVALVAIQKNGDTLVRQNRIASASSQSHKVTLGNRNFAGALRVSQNQREEVIKALEEAIDSRLPGNAIDLSLVALTRARVQVDAADLWAAPYARSADNLVRESVASELESLNLGQLRLKMANRANDGFYSVFFLRKFSKLLTWLAVRVKATPNQVTLISFAIGLYSAFCFTQGSFSQTLLGAVLLQISIIVDCVDGELARYTRKFSKLGAWLDAVTDRVKEYMVFLGLAIGAEKSGEDLWIPALVMMLIQTFRHLSDYNFARSVKLRAESQFLAPIDYAADFDGIVPTEREPKGRLRYWLGKIIQFPIGERWLVISASAVIGGASFTFTVMPILAAISALVVYRGRIMRTLKMERAPSRGILISAQQDSLILKLNFIKRFDWLAPSLLRAIETLLLLWIFIINEEINAVTFMIIFTIVFHHYDNLYRSLQNEKKPVWLSRLGLFIEGRLLLLGIAAFGEWNLSYITWYFALLFLLTSSLQWALSHRANKVR
ncbi:MAG: CDP-alcohol phosphatidyltransferase family protein [Candidatus Nanopelagicaceae bacterium]|nr:CDP-alcohol phosphatidyltransferase family protein [Candidatus Nanopelagicaceae bacterium]